jgi:hypothetical protein
MQLLALAAMLIALQGELVQYDLDIDQVYLDQLYADPYSGMSFPAMLSCEQGVTSCMVGFRGESSLAFPKKNWSIELDDPYLFGRSMLILNAHFRDTTLTRDCLALMITDLLGYPAPETRHVRFSINGDYYGVYLDTERIDTDFLLRSGFEEGSLFKATEHEARFCWLPSGYWYDFCFEPCIDSDPLLRDVRSFIDRVNSGAILPAADTEMFLAYYAVTLAIMDLDAPTKNYYLYQPSDSIWRIFPWDRDATFGNDWQGQHHPELVTWVTSDLLIKTSLLSRLLEDPVNLAFFSACLDSTAVLMADVLPVLLDSIYAEIRSDVCTDPQLQLTPQQFDDAFSDLCQFVVDRPQHILGIGSSYEPVIVESLIIDPVHIETSTDSVRITLTTHSPLDQALLEYSVDFGDVDETAMRASPGSDSRVWECAVAAYDINRSITLSAKMYPLSTGDSQVYFYYPRYGFLDYPQRTTVHPGSIRLQGIFDPSLLLPLPPVRYGPDLWALPLVNVQVSSMDLSMCAVSIGDSSGWVFFPESVFVLPGDTVFITDNARALQGEFPSRDCFGDCAVPSPAGKTLTLFDPAWNICNRAAIPDEEASSHETEALILSEICYDSPLGIDSGDWIELYSNGTDSVDIGGFILVDASGNMSLIPWGTSIGSAQPFVIASEPGRFALVNPGVDIGATMSFSLAAGGDAVILLDRTGVPSFSVSYTNDPPWPDASGMVLSLLYPSLPLSSPESWEAVCAPGSPGSINPSWSTFIDQHVSILMLWPNPTVSAFSVRYSGHGAPVTGSIFDLSGRLVQHLPDLPPVSAEILVQLDESLYSGVYFLVLQSSGDCSIRRFVCLR